MNRTLAVVMVALAAGVGQGCMRTEYTVDIEPTDEGFTRTVRAGTPHVPEGSDETVLAADQEELNRLADLYGQGPSDGVAVRGRFAADTPNDIGGAGVCKAFRSPMGEAWYYAERLRGDDDVVRQIERIRKGVDEIVGVLTGWFRAEMGASAETDKLRDFLNGPFRRDVENLAVYMWVDKFSSDHKSPYAKAAGGDLAARIGVYVLERGYVRVEDVPRLTRAVRKGQYDVLCAFLQRTLATRMGVPAGDPIPKSLAFLARPEAITQSLGAYLAGTEKYKQLLDEHQRKNPPPAAGDEVADGDDEGKEAPHPVAVLGEPLLAVAVPFWGFLRSYDRVNMSLTTGVEPTAHNGKWDSTTGKVRWTCDVHLVGGRKSELPAIMWATWQKPNEAFQTKHFGKVVLSGEALVGHCMWYNGLSDAETERWDAFVASLAGGEDLESKADRAFGDVEFAELLERARGLAKTLAGETPDGESSTDR